MYVIAGERLLRAEGGAIRQYNVALGSWDQYAGVIHEAVLSSVEETFLHVEGFYRDLKGDERRTSEGVLAALEVRFRPRKTVAARAELLAHFRSNCAHNVGNSLLRAGAHRKGHRKGGDSIGGAVVEEESFVGGDEGIEPPAGTWHVVVGQTVSKFASQLLREMLHKEVWTYFTEWCSLPCRRRPGIRCWTLSRVYCTRIRLGNPVKVG